jgi:hypothetical protein|tara:strand:- start:545 stop:646 length:102 start_codon:yes stop_codon:yes gene_type:complete
LFFWNKKELREQDFIKGWPIGRQIAFKKRLDAC